MKAPLTPERLERLRRAGARTRERMAKALPSLTPEQHAEIAMRVAMFRETARQNARMPSVSPAPRMISDEEVTTMPLQSEHESNDSEK